MHFFEDERFVTVTQVAHSPIRVTKPDKQVRLSGES